MKRINIFVGNYGSGKTELAINAALKLKEEHEEVALADIDIVNPYFRSSEHKEMLEGKGIRVLMPEYANTAVDLPTLPVGIYSVFTGDAYAVLDCGGDPAGATTLGALKPHIEKAGQDTQVYFVLNTRRPLQETAAQAIEMVRAIEHVSRIKVTGLINNTNIANETTLEPLLEGREIANQVSAALQIPVSYVSGKKEILDAYRKAFPEEGDKLFEISIFMRPYWMES